MGSQLFLRRKICHASVNYKECLPLLLSKKNITFFIYGLKKNHNQSCMLYIGNRKIRLLINKIDTFRAITQKEKDPFMTIT